MPGAASGVVRGSLSAGAQETRTRSVARSHAKINNWSCCCASVTTHIQPERQASVAAVFPQTPLITYAGKIIALEHIDVRGRNPMVIEEDCVATCLDKRKRPV